MKYKQTSKFMALLMISSLLFLGSCSQDHDLVEEIETVSSQSFVVSGKTTNLALGKTAEQSSTGYEAYASRAVDGNTSGVWNDGSVTHTNKEYQPWWQVRLGDDYEIDQIVIWNRTNCCMDRLSNFDVFIYNDAGVQVFKETIEDTPNPSVTIDAGGVVGARVRVKLKGDQDPLSLAEVQVFGGDGSSSSYPSLPTKIEAEDYVFQYGTSPEYDKDGSGSTTLGWIGTGDYMEYNVNVPSSGTYAVNFRVASKSAGTNLDIYQGNSVVGSISTTQANGWYSWYEVSTNVQLSSGDQTIKIVSTKGGWNFNWMEFTNGGDSGVSGVEWQNWYLSVPVDRGDGSGKAMSIYYEDIEALNLTNEEKTYFDQNSDGSYKMNTKYTGYTTSGQYGLDEAKYCRTELREYWQGNQSTSDNWSMASGTHIMESTLKVESIGGDGRTYVGQIHGYPTGELSKSPATIKVQWNNGDIVLEYYTADGIVDGEWTVANDIAETVAEVGYEKFTIKIKIEDGKLFLAVVCDAKGVNTGYVEYYDYVGNGYAYDNYFKTGNYFKWNDDYTETSEVTLYGVSTYHD